MKINIFSITLLAIFAFISCDKMDDTSVTSIEGTYIGTLKFSSLNSANSIVQEGTSIITKTDDQNIQVHCFGGDLDTTFMLNYYEHNDSILVCLTGNNFQHHYGHGLGQGHKNGGGMMGHLNEDETQWAHHLNDEHQEGDEHFGGFHLGNHMFNYSIKTEHGYYHFEGQKQ